MKKLFAILFLCQPVLSQAQAVYNSFIQTADSLYAVGKYEGAAHAYSAAFESLGWKAYQPDRFHAARAWAMAGAPDSAFFNLFRIAERANYDNLEELTQEKAFHSLYALPRWTELSALVKSNMPTQPALAKMLGIILEDDQKYRMMDDSIEKRFGRESPEIKAHWKRINEKDSLNTLQVAHILDTYGWLGTKEVGTNNVALFLVVQHADLAVQEKYLPMMREAVKNKKAKASDLALLEDRVLMRTGKKQIYGSQIRSKPDTGAMYVYAIEDVDHVDERRAFMGLGSLVDYAAYFDIKWDAAAIEANRNMPPDSPELRKK